MGGGGTTDADLSHGAVAAMSRMEEGLQPVLQVADVTRLAVAPERYRLMLSDGVHSLPGALSPSLRRFVRDGELRRGAVVRVLKYICEGAYSVPSIIGIIQLEILQTECALIGCPVIYEGSSTKPGGVSCSCGVGSHDQEPCLQSGAQKDADNLSCSPGQGTLDSSVAPRAEHAVQYGGCYDSILAEKTLDTKMKKLALDDHQNQRFPVTTSTTSENFGTDSTSGSPLPPLSLLPSLVCTERTLGAKMQELSLDDHQNKRFPATTVGNFGAGGTSGSPLPPLSLLPLPVCTDRTLDAKMQELSLDDHQNKNFPVTTTVKNFGIGSTSGSPLSPLSLQPSPVSMDRSRVAKNGSPCLITPVAALNLNSYTNRWTIKGTVTSKTYLKQYGIFSCDLIDAQGGEIRANCLNPCKADRFFDLIEVDKVYMISGEIVKHVQNRYLPLNGDYEIFVDDPVSIEVCPDDDSSIPRLAYNFRKIKEIGKLENGSLVDLLGVVTSVSPSATMMSKNGIGTSKRKLLLKDMSDRSVEITLWGIFCDKEGQQLQCLLESGSNPILAVKRCRIRDGSGRSLATISYTHLKVNPDLPEAERLRQWYMTEGKMASCMSLSQPFVYKTIAQIKDARMGQSVVPDLISVRATISHVSTICYPACTLEFNGKQCNRKVNKNTDGTWNCSRCMVDLPKCEYRYLLMCQLQDRTGVTYATAFQEAGTKIIGYSAEELSNLRDQDEAKWSEVLLGVRWQEYFFKLNIEEETLHGETCVKWSIVGANKIRRIGCQQSSLKRNANSLGMGLETVRYRLRT